MLLLVIIAMMLSSVVLASIWSNSTYLQWSLKAFNWENSTTPIDSGELNDRQLDLRAASDSKLYQTLMNPIRKPNFYYEEQMPVVVYSKSDINDNILTEVDQDAAQASSRAYESIDDDASLENEIEKR